MSEPGMESDLGLPRTVQPQKLDGEQRLFRHKLRPQWGVGLWVSGNKRKRRLRFEDGRLRAIAKGFYDLLEPVNPERVDVDAVLETLESEHQSAKSREANPSKPPVMTLPQQLQVFGEVFEGGFDGQEYAQERRPDGAEKRANVGLASLKAQELLAEEALRASTPQQARERLVNALGETAWVGPSKLKPLQRELSEDKLVKLREGLIALLWGEGRFRKRFDQWVAALGAALGRAPGWRLATAPAALVHPDKQVFVRRQVMSLQARLFGGKPLEAKPSGAAYRRARRTALALRKELNRGTEQAERDMLDVAVFVWETLRPSGQKLLNETPQPA
ncbi:MAG: hypothetical protein VX899_10700 [Myxococcota bacterium]|nr:hypothetical protein [Myxococcota bacterium]